MPVFPVTQIASGPLSEFLHAFPGKILNVCWHVVIRIFLPFRNSALSKLPSRWTVRSGDENRSTRGEKQLAPADSANWIRQMFNHMRKRNDVKGPQRIQTVV